MSTEFCYLIEANLSGYGLGCYLYASLRTGAGGWHGTTGPNMATRFMHRHEAEEMLQSLKLPRPLWHVESHGFYNDSMSMGESMIAHPEDV